MAPPICVLSSGRSGTSLAARALNLLGVDLGPEGDMLQATAMNERGYWENLGVMSLNDAILERLGGSLFRPPSLPEGWEERTDFDDLRDRAAALIAETFPAAAEGARWGFKDPRTVMTLPLWRQVAGEMDYVICARRAEEVVASTLRGLPDEHPDDLAQWWLDLNVLALERTLGRRRVFVFYEDWFADPDRVARELATFVHGDVGAVDEDTWRQIHEFFDPSLRNFQAESDGEALPAPELDAMYGLLRLVQRADAAGAGQALQEQQLDMARVLAESHRRVLPARREARAMVERLAHAEAQSADAVARVAQLEQELTQARADVTTLHESVTWAQGYIGDLERFRDELVAERDELQRGRRDAEERAAALQRQVATLQASASWRMTAPLRAAKRRAAGRP